MCIKDRRKKESRGQTQKKENTCTKKIQISVEMDLVAAVVVVVVVVAAEKKIEVVLLASHLLVFVLDLVLNLFVLCKLAAVVLKNLLLMVLIVYAMFVDLVLVVAL